MKNWKTVLAVVGVFILGMLAGGLLTVKIAQHVLRGGPEAMNRVIVRRLSWQLRLDAAQRDQVRTIVRQAQSDMKAVREEVRPEVTGILDRAIKQVRDRLRPEQAEKFDQLVAKRRAEWLANHP